jgi:hypothetical protein
MAVLLSFLTVLAISTRPQADQALFSGKVRGSGYLNVNYAWIGSASRTTAYNGFRITGSLVLADTAGTVRLSCRSHHFLQLRRPDGLLYDDSYENRNNLHTAYLEFNTYLNKNLRVRLGRQFPDMPYSSASPIDGVWTQWTWAGWKWAGSVGQAVDAWSGSSAPRRLQYGMSLSANTAFMQWSAGYLARHYDDMPSQELQAGASAAFRKRFSIVSSLAYEIGLQRQGVGAALSRANMSLSWCSGHGSLSISGSHWRNAFDQLVVDQQNKDILYFGTDAVKPPRDYRDVRLTGSYRWQQWKARGSVGYLAGVRSGWVSQGHIELPPLINIRCGVGGQVTRTDYIHSYSANAAVSSSWRSMELRLSSESRIYQWQPSQSGFTYGDNHTELNVEYPVRNDLYMSVQIGAYFRRLGDETTKPLLKATLFYRL